MSLYHILKLKLAAELLVTLAGEVMLLEDKLGAGRGRWRKSRLVSLRAVAHDLGVACGRPMIICLLPCYGCLADHRCHVISIQSVVNDGYCLPSLLLVPLLQAFVLLACIAFVAFGWGDMMIGMLSGGAAWVLIFLLLLSAKDRLYSGLTLDQRLELLLMLGLVVAVELFNIRSYSQIIVNRRAIGDLFDVFQLLLLRAIRFWVRGGGWDRAKDVDIVYVIMVLSGPIVRSIIIETTIRFMTVHRLRYHIAAVLDIAIDSSRLLLLS